jgi:hypothetical protein
MDRLIEGFGNAVGDAIATSPRRALTLLKAGYTASAVLQQILPDKRLLPHQRYVAAMNTRAIRRPLSRPDRSAMVNLFFLCELLHAMEVLFPAGHSI